MLGVGQDEVGTGVGDGEGTEPALLMKRVEIKIKKREKVSKKNRSHMIAEDCEVNCANDVKGKKIWKYSSRTLIVSLPLILTMR